MEIAPLLYFFGAGWLCLCIFYLYRIHDLKRAKGLHLFSPAKKLSSTSRIVLRKYWQQIIIISLITLSIVLIAFVIRNSS